MIFCSTSMISLATPGGCLPAPGVNDSSLRTARTDFASGRTDLQQIAALDDVGGRNCRAAFA
jgi:hypothetical protein